MTNIYRPQPPISEDESLDFLHVYLVDCKVIIVVNRPALASLVWAFWFMAVECPAQESITLSSSEEIPEPPEGEYLSGCSITILDEHTVRDNYFLRDGDTVEVLLPRNKAEQAYDTLKSFSDRQPKDMDEVELLGKFAVKLIEL